MPGEHIIPNEENNIDSTGGGPTFTPPPPAAAIPTSELPFPLTFFLTAAQRAAVLRRLSAVHEDRVTALLTLLELTSPIR